MASFGFQSFDIENNIGKDSDFGGKTIKVSLEGEYLAKPVNIFANLRGGLAMSDEISGDDFIIDADNYFRMDLLFGAKQNYEIKPNLTLGWKIFAGVPLSANNSLKIKTNTGNGTIDGYKEGAIFGGVGGKVNYEIIGGFNAFIGANVEIDESLFGYSAYLGFSERIGK